MNNEARYVFDTNTIVSAFLFDQANPGRALQEALKRGKLLLSMEVVKELDGALWRSKFDRYVRRKTREEFLRTLIHEAVFVDVTETIETCRGAKDDEFLELTVRGGASHIVTGDKDLLV